MTQFQLFDAVKLKEPIPISDPSWSNAPPEGNTAPEGTPGAIVEVFNNGEAYIVELFGSWVKYDEQGDFISASRSDVESFMETIAVETVYPHQLRLVKPARETMGAKRHLASILEDLPEELIAEIRDFAEFLQQKQRQQSGIGDQGSGIRQATNL